jgi:cytochrome c556
MRIGFLAAAASLALLAACNQTKTAAPANESTTAVAPAGTMQARVNLGPVDKSKAAAVMHERHEGMETIGKTIKALHREFDSSAPNMATVKESAKKIADLSQKASNWFQAGTGPDVGKTGAKPAIWQHPDDFTAKLTAFQKAAKTFDDVAAKGDAAAAKAAYGDLGKTCKACHDSYRAEMKH